MQFLSISWSLAVSPLGIITIAKNKLSKSWIMAISLQLTFVFGAGHRDIKPGDVAFFWYLRPPLTVLIVSSAKSYWHLKIDYTDSELPINFLFPAWERWDHPVELQFPSWFFRNRHYLYFCWESPSFCCISPWLVGRFYCYFFVLITSRIAPLKGTSIWRNGIYDLFPTEFR